MRPGPGSRIEADAVIDGSQAQPVSLEVQLYLRARCVGVLDDVVQAFLGDAERRVLDGGRQSLRGARDFELDDTIMSTVQGSKVLFQSDEEAFLLERHRSQLEDQRAHLG